MKKIFWSVLCLGALAMVACEKDEGGKRNEQGGGGSQQQEPVVPTASWCDHLFTFEYTITPETATYNVASVDLSEITNHEGKHVYELLGYDTFEAMCDALGLLADKKAAPTDGELCWFGVNGVTEFDIETPGNTNGWGHWYDALGNEIGWGDDARVFCEFYLKVQGEAEGEYEYEAVGNVGTMDNPALYKVGDSFTAREKLVYHPYLDDEVSVGLQFTVKFDEFKDPEAGKYNPANRKNTETTVTATVTEPAQLKQLDALQDAFQLTKAELSTAIGEGLVSTKNYINDEEVEQSAGGFGGVWFDAEGNRTTWGEETGATYFIELFSTTTELYVNVGFFNETSYAAVQGKTFNNFKQVVTYTPEEGTSYTCTINYNITF